MGYKRLAGEMANQQLAYLRAYQVRNILNDCGHLIHHGPMAEKPLRRPAPPERPDQVWHIDLMYVLIGQRWYYLVDILDGYSRYLVHWRLNLTMTCDSVMMVVQEALDKLKGDQSCRQEDSPTIVHDNGSQFVSTEWKMFAGSVGFRDVRTRVAHPESNGRLERLHRTHREEGLAENPQSYSQGVQIMERWADYYNHRRAHSALQYLRPVDYYRGDPKLLLLEREAKMARALEGRREFWSRQPIGAGAEL